MGTYYQTPIIVLTFLFPGNNGHPHSCTINVNRSINNHWKVAYSFSQVTAINKEMKRATAFLENSNPVTCLLNRIKKIIITLSIS